MDGLPSAKEYDYCVLKGVDPELHPYGACFHDIEEKLSTGLIEWLRCQNADTLSAVWQRIIVRRQQFYSCLKAGLESHQVNQAACRGIAPETVESAWQGKRSAGAVVLENAEEIKKYINNHKYILKSCFT